MARTHQKPLPKCQAEKKAITSKQITLDKGGKKKYKRGNLTVTKNNDAYSVHIRKEMGYLCDIFSSTKKIKQI